jgi:hypothetical protein
VTALDDTQAELLQLLSPALYPPPATPVALPIVAAPTDPYGRDLVCFEELAGDGAQESEGLPQLAQDNFHRVTTARGKIPGYPNDGIDIRELLSKGMTPTAVADIPGQLRSELLKDKRNREVRVTPALEGADTLRLVIRCTPVVGEAFDLTMTASAAAVRLLGVK